TVLDSVIANDSPGSAAAAAERATGITGKSVGDCAGSARPSNASTSPRTLPHARNRAAVDPPTAARLHAPGAAASPAARLMCSWCRRDRREERGGVEVHGVELVVAIVIEAPGGREVRRRRERRAPIVAISLHEAFARHETHGAALRLDDATG